MDLTPVTLRKPESTDGYALNSLVERCKPLDTNSVYCNLLQCSDFADTSIAAENANGRDHNPHGFTMWMAGGGAKRGLVYGRTDDYGYYAVEQKVHFHDLHATILHLLGLDHTELTSRFSGRDFRLTDVHGNVVDDLLA